MLMSQQALVFLKESAVSAFSAATAPNCSTNDGGGKAYCFLGAFMCPLQCVSASMMLMLGANYYPPAAPFQPLELSF